MNEENILGQIAWAIQINSITKSINGDNTSINVNVLKGLLDLYNKEKEKNIALKNIEQQICNEVLIDTSSKEFIEKYIPKDKIRALIKEIYNEKLNEEIYIEKELKGYAIDKIEELLEE